MKKLLVSSLLLLLALTACGQKEEAVVEEEKNNLADAVAAEHENAEIKLDEYEGQYVVEEVSIDDNGTNIYGKLYLPSETKENYPTIIMSHGVGGNYLNCEPYAQFFAANGYAALAYDFQGGGPASKSDGQMKDMTVLTEAQDLDVVVAYMLEQDYVQKENLFLFGESQGGFVSSYVAAHTNDKLNSIILLYPAFVLQDDAWAKYPNGAEEAPEVEEAWGLQIGRQSYIDSMSFDIYEVIPGFEKDVLIIHGANDPVVPLKYSERAKEVYTSCEIEVLDGPNEHGFNAEQIKIASDKALSFTNAHLVK